MAELPKVSSRSTGTQTDSSLCGKKVLVYEKIEDLTRCELIRMLQQDRRRLKDAAAALNINYSTAKTIVQTFRRERRVTRKKKQTLETKKGLKRELRLRDNLTKQKLAAVYARILQSEMGLEKPAVKEPNVEPLNAPGTTIPTAAVTREGDPEAVTTFKRAEKSFARALSAAEMCLISEEEKGAQLRQISQATQTCLSLTPAKNHKAVFAVYTESNPEEQFKDQIDYQNLVRLRIKKTSLAVSHSSPPQLPALSPVLLPSGMLGGLKETLPAECLPNLSFSFSFVDYTKRIWAEAIQW